MPLTCTALSEPTAHAWIFTNHLRRRALERGISDAQIQAVLTEPDITYCQRSYGPNRQVRQRDDLGVVVDVASRAVITVVFRDPARWTNHPTAAVAA